MIGLLLGVASLLPAQLVPGGKSMPVEAEVRRNLLEQPIGAAKVADLQLDPRFVDRVVDRVIRSTYRERCRAVSPDQYSDVMASGGAVPAHVNIINVQWPKDLLNSRVQMPPQHPAPRGYRAPILGSAAPPPGDEAVIRVVAEHLASDGLLDNLDRIIALRGSTWVAGAEGVERLRAAGYPVDLLAHFGDGVTATLTAVCAHADDGRTEHDSSFPPRFRWRPTLRGFQAATESGEWAIGGLRAQVTRPALGRAAGAGGGLDIVRQMLSAVPDVPCTLTVQSRNLPGLKQSLAEWGPAHPGPITVLTTLLPLAQWAQDNGQPGLAEDGTGTPRAVVLLPRYASQREESSLFLPNESFLMNDLADQGLATGHSPLLFQGGNIIVVRHPRTGQRLALVGEAEIYRNSALGLSRAEVEAALSAELGVDRVIVLPALAAHIDTEVTVRAVGAQLVAFVNDPPRAARLIIDAGLPALEEARLVSAEQVASWSAALRSGADCAPLVREIEAILAARRGSEPFSIGVTRHFSRGPADSGAGNLTLFLTALETLAFEPPAGDPHAEAHQRALQRRRVDRVAFRAALQDAGCTLVEVPGLSDYTRGINYLNGLHEPGRYLMPTWGGLYATVDAAAARAFRDACGPGVDIIGILSAESQRQGGAVHCSCMVLPAAPQPGP